jgi:hypothetical protein
MKIISRDIGDGHIIVIPEDKIARAPGFGYYSRNKHESYNHYYEYEDGPDKSNRTGFKLPDKFRLK